MSMRQRPSTAVPTLDEEHGTETPPPSSSSMGKKKKRRRHSFKKLLPSLLAVGALMLLIIIVVWIAVQQSKPPSSLPRRRPLFQPQVGPSTKCQTKLLLTRDKLDKSLALGTTFLLNHQKPEGNFDYEYDWIHNVNTHDDVEVRQAGALWGLTLIFHDQMDSSHNDKRKNENVLKTMAAHVLRGVNFFQRHSAVLSDKHHDHYPVMMRYLTYPNDETRHGTGTQALVCLALIDFLRGLQTPQDALVVGISQDEYQRLFTLLDELLAFLVTQHSQALVLYEGRLEAYSALQESGQEITHEWFGSANPTAMIAWWQQHQGPYMYGYFYDKFDENGNRKGQSSPYYDGEALLAITKAAKYLHYRHLWPMAVGTAHALYKRHVEDALEEDDDSDDTKGIYQWLSMSLFELATVTFGEGYIEPFDLPVAMETTYPQELFGTRLVELAEWMVDVHGTLRKSKNTGYAYEGIVPAWAWASHVVQQERERNDEELEATARKLSCTIEEGMTKLISWQVGMGAEEDADDWDGIKGLGGVQNEEDEPGLRIDVTQHQMHATILTRRLVYAPRGEEATWPWNDVVLSQ